MSYEDPLVLFFVFQRSHRGAAPNVSSARWTGRGHRSEKSPALGAFALPFPQANSKLPGMNKRTLLAAGLVTVLFASSLRGAEAVSNAPPESAAGPDKEPKKSDQSGKPGKEKSKEPEEKLVETEHSAMIGGQEIRYKAAAAQFSCATKRTNRLLRYSTSPTRARTRRLLSAR